MGTDYLNRCWTQPLETHYPDRTSRNGDFISFRLGIDIALDFWVFFDGFENEMF